MPAKIPILSIIVAALCLGLGWAVGMFSAGIRTAPAPLPESTAQPTSPPVPSPAPDQTSILIVTINTGAAVKPALDGCWVLTFQPGTNQYYLLGFPLDTPVGKARSLLDYYNAGLTPHDSVRLVEEAIKIVTEGSLIVQYQVVADRQTVADLADWVGGISLNGEKVTGSSLIERYASLGSDPNAQVHFQGEALAAFTEALKLRAWTNGDLDQLLIRYQQASLDADALLSLAKQALPIDQADFAVRIFEPSP